MSTLKKSYAAPPFAADALTATINKAGYITTFHTALATLLKIDAAQAIGSLLSHWVVAPEKEKAAVYTRQALSGAPVYGHLAFDTGKDEKIICNITAVPLLDSGRICGACLFFKDVTHKVNKNKQLHHNEEQLKAILASDPACVTTVSPDGMLLDINPAGLQMLGVKKREELIGKSCLKWIHPEDREAYKRLYRQVAEGQKGALQFKMVDAKGAIHWMENTAVPLNDKNGNINSMLSIARDVSEKKKGDQQLQQLASDLQKIMDASLDVICAFDMDGKFVQASKAAYTLWGYQPEELIGRFYIDLVAKEDKARSLKAGRSIRMGKGVTNFENTFIRIDGVPVPMVWSARWDAAQGLMYCVGRDATEKKKAEAQLRTQEIRLEKAKQLAKIGYWEYDIRTAKSYATDGLYEIYGISRTQYPEISFDVFLNLVHPDDKAQLQARIDTLLTVPIIDFEHRILRPDGTVVYVFNSGETVQDKKGTPIRISGAVQDITERKEAELNLTASQQKFRSLVQNASDLIAILDEEAVIQYASPSITDIAGYSPDELVGQNAFGFIHPDDAAELLDELGKVKVFTNSGKPTAHRFLTKEGNWIWLETKGTNLLNDDHIKGLVINAREITDRILLQQKLDAERAQRQQQITAAVIKAQEAERSQLGQELHDNVNQVLTTIKLYNEMALGNAGDKDDILKKSIYHLQGCISEIRSISKRLSAPTLGKISLKDSVQDLVDSINLTNKLAIHFSIEGLSGVPVSEDVHLTLYRIIQEQLNNIIKHAGARKVAIQIKKTPQALTLEIKDDGKGFNPHEKRRGIGITNMIMRAENMGGQLMLQSSPQSGCQLVVQFPSLPAPAPHNSKP